MNERYSKHVAREAINSMQQRFSSEANGRLAAQEISRLLWIPSLWS
jgi:hypothetical protein